ncbi:MAG: VIT domain-containing protein [Gemmatimonadales bacterium]
MLSASRVAGLSLVLFTLVSPAVVAQGWIEPDRPVVLVPPRGGVERIRSSVQVSVLGRVARVTVEEWFRNTGPVMDEGHYLYPLPGEAVFSNFSLWQGDQELRGETMDAAQARAIYESIVRQKRDPALIELAGHGLLRARVFPINAGETRKITLRYTQVLDRAGDAWRFRYPGARGGGSAAPAATSFRLQVDSAARFGDPYSPTHRLTTRRDGGRLEVGLADSAGRGDVELLLPLARGLVGMSLLTHRPPGEDGFFMLLLAPGAAARTEAVRRDVALVIDVSGSMSGEKLDQAKTALAQLIGTLREGDRFRVVAFANGVRRFDAGWTPATAGDRQRAQEWVRALGTDGGTNIAGALGEALASPPADGALGVVVFLTDGMPTAGETDPERIARAAEQGRGRFRVFAFGIGYDVNTYLLDRLTERARGTTEYIQPGGDIERAVGSLASKIASPVLTDLALSADHGLEVYDVQPGSLPDLFAGDELVVFGRYRAAGSGERAVTVRGRRNGAEERFRTTAPATGDSPGNDYIPALWAARKAGALSREIRLHGQNRELMDALKELALRYGILTEYTSYLVQEPTAVARSREEQRILARGAGAPIQQTGADAVAQSVRENELSRTAVLDGAATRRDLDAGLGAVHGPVTQRVGGRLFVWRDSTWTDLRHAESHRVVTVAPFSAAYFALLRALPELVKPAALEPAVLVAGRTVSVKIESAGRDHWAAGELEQLVREFR